MSDQKKSGDDASSEGVVKVRRVVSRPMSWQEQEERKGGEAQAKAAEAANPNAPKPTPQNEYVPHLVQMRRRHKSQQRETPNYMSDIKI